MKKALIIYYSQAGQTRSAVESFRQGLGESHHCDVAEIRCAEEFRFPWKINPFFRAMPRCQRGPYPRVQLDIAPAWDTYDLIVFAYQVWFLAPSLPALGFLNSEMAENFRGKPVVTLVTCRNLWQSAFLKVKKRLQQTGAIHLGQITLCELSPLWASFVTTPRWMLTGKKSAFSIFPEAGISMEEFAKLRQLGQRVGYSVQSRSEVHAVNLNRVSLELMDAIGAPFFRFWSKVIHQFVPNAGGAQDALLLLFRLNLMLLIISAGPCTKIFESIVGNDFHWIAKIRRYRSL